MRATEIPFALVTFLLNVGVYAIHSLPSIQSMHELVGVIQLSPAQLAAFVPFTQFARAAYCDPSIIAGWNCGGLYSLVDF